MTQPASASPVKKSEILGWCCFDFANSAFTTIIITVVYSVYFQKVVAAGNSQAEGWWGTALAASQLVVIALSPLVGAVADVMARKKQFLMGTAFVCSVATAALYFVGEGEVALALGLVIIANIAFSLSENLCSAFLPEISTPENAGRISGYGWSFGYFGGLLSLVLALWIIRSGEGRTPYTFLMTGGFFFAASLPTLLLLRERAQPQKLAAGDTLFALGWRQLAQMRHDLPKHRTLAVFFIALTLYLSGLMAVVGFAALYATNVIGMSQQEVIQLFVVLQLAGVVGAFGFGFLQDRTGSKFALILSLILWIVVGVWASVSTTKLEFYMIGTIAGVAMGALQSASRAVVSTLTPPGRAGEFFGYWGFFGKLAGVVGPLVFGWLVTSTSYRIAIVVNAGFFLAGLLVLLPLSLKPQVLTDSVPE
ncbi:MAG: MFS transporter [Opitutaceae bacterium]|jgi:UMF1 family MFS transporter